MVKAEPPRVAVIGAGPVGVEAALAAKAAGCRVSVYDRGQVGEHLARWGHARMFTPFGMNTTPLGLQTLRHERRAKDVPADTDFLTGRQFREAYLVPLSESEALLESMNPQNAVLAIGRSGSVKKSEPDDGRRPFRLLLRGANGAERIDTADAVLDCTGTFNTPNWLGEGNLPAVGELAARAHIGHNLEDVLGDRRPHYAGKSIAVVGDGYTAAVTIVQLAALAEEHAETWVFWLTNGARGAPLPRVPNDPLKERDRLAVKANSLATRCDANLEFHPQTLLDEVVCHGPEQGFRVGGRSAGKPMTWEVERVIACVGYRADLRLSTGLKVDEPSGRPETREPGYYLLGAKSFGRDSGFLLRDGHEQVRRVVGMLTGQVNSHGSRRAA
ncbi:MAG TPA: NAD-binding protein [Urbifossiella sp.]|nr:NAD-binding protein [Urbifossiella sp.]